MILILRLATGLRCRRLLSASKSLYQQASLSQFVNVSPSVSLSQGENQQQLTASALRLHAATPLAATVAGKNSRPPTHTHTLKLIWSHLSSTHQLSRFLHSILLGFSFFFHCSPAALFHHLSHSTSRPPSLPPSLLIHFCTVYSQNLSWDISDQKACKETPARPESGTTWLYFAAVSTCPASSHQRFYFILFLNGGMHCQFLMLFMCIFQDFLFFVQGI